MSKPAANRRLPPPSAAAIRKAIKELRVLIDTTKDPCESRIAYAMETAIVWATKHTEGWSAPAITARQLAKFLRQEL